MTVTVRALSRSLAADDLVEACHFEQPRCDADNEVYVLPLSGWVVSRHSTPLAIELIAEGRVISQVPLTARDDLAELYPDTPADRRVGFRTALNSLRLPTEFTFEVRVSHADGRSVSLGAVSGTREPLRSSFTPRLRPLLIKNIGRSGSTWVTHLFGQHPAILAYRPFELEPRVASYWVEVFRALAEPASYGQSLQPQHYGDDWWVGSRRSAPPPAIQDDPAVHRWLGRDGIEELAGFCQKRIESFYGVVASANGVRDPAYFVERSYGSGRVVDRLIHELYPGARDVLLVRDFRDVYCSILSFNRRTGLKQFGRDRAEGEEDYLRNVFGPMVRGLLFEWRRRDGSAFLLRYEDVILRPEETLHLLFGHLGLASDDALISDMLDRANASRRERQQTHKTSSGPATSIGRWHRDLDPALVGTCEECFGDALQAFGYASGFQS